MVGVWYIFMDRKTKSKGRLSLFLRVFRHWLVLCWKVLGILAQMRLNCMVCEYSEYSDVVWDGESEGLSVIRYAALANNIPPLSFP